MASYAKGNYDFDNLEQIEEFVAFTGAYEITSVLKDIDDASYKSENFVILGYFLEYCNDNPYINEFLGRTYHPKEETNALQEIMEEEITETGSSLDEKEEESDKQKEE